MKKQLEARLKHIIFKPFEVIVISFLVNKYDMLY